MYLYSTPSWMAYALENMLILKLLYDRGFNVGELGEIAEGFVGRFLDIMFGQDNVIWEKTPIEPPADMDELDEDTDKYFMLKEYLDRSHYEVEIKIDGLSKITEDPQVKKILMEILQQLVPSEEDFLDGVFPWYEFFVNVSWLEELNQIVGIRFLFADVIDGCCDEEAPASIVEHLKIFVEFWDQLQLYAEEVQKSA